VRGLLRGAWKELDAGSARGPRKFSDWRAKNPQLAEELATTRASAHTLPADTKQRTPALGELWRASRVSGRHEDCHAQGGSRRAAAARAKNPLLVGGSADLYGSTLNYIGDLKTGNDDFKPGPRSGATSASASREHGMCSIMNGIAATASSARAARRSS
jgi:transketolase